MTVVTADATSGGTSMPTASAIQTRMIVTAPAKDAAATFGCMWTLLRVVELLLDEAARDHEQSISSNAVIVDRKFFNDALLSRRPSFSNLTGTPGIPSGCSFKNRSVFAILRR